ncbi:MAG: hypothetical protein IJR58_06310 [Lachnospiraceae bacterium]|nr:hypothetical protein [Lachnospiraceae bacterium]
MKKQETFIVEVTNTENATWQGQITWANEKRRQYFRSALELLRLMDSVLEGGTDKEVKETDFARAESIAS